MSDQANVTADEIREKMNPDDSEPVSGSSNGEDVSSAPEDTGFERIGEGMDFSVPDDVPTQSFDCETCNDTGTLQEPNKFQMPEFCECDTGDQRREEYEQTLWDRMRLPADYRGDNLRTFKTDDVTQSIRDVYQDVSVYCEKFGTMVDRGIGLYVFGDNGTGKTHLLVSVLKRAGRYFGYRDNPLYIETTKFIRAHRPDSREIFSDIDPMKDPYNAPIVFLDELDDIQGTRYDFQILQDFIKTRYNNNLPTLIAANTPFEELEETVAIETVRLNGMVSRLTEMCKTLSVHGEDKRRRY